MILLTFDDCHIAEWSALFPWMLTNDVRATFYVSDQDKITAENWMRLRDLGFAGNAIGFHGLNHLDASKVTNWPGYVEDEIDRGLELMEANEISPEYFAYPYGHYTTESHAVLKERFLSLRTLCGGLYPGPALPRIFGAHEFETGKTDAEILSAKSPGQILAVVMHKPIMARLERLLTYAREFGEAFGTVDDIQWKAEA